MRVENNTTAYIQAQKKAFAETGKFDEIYSAMKLSRNTESHVKLDALLVGTGNYERYEPPKTVTYELGENGLPIGMTRWEDLGVYTEPEQPELVEWPTPPTYPDSIYDLSATEWANQSWAAMRKSEDIDTTGMTRGQIYDAVRSVFEQYLGEDFKQPHYTNNSVGQVEDLWGIPAAKWVQLSFEKALNYHGIVSHKGVEHLDSTPALEASEYAGMEKSEIMAAVRAKYPETMTLGECMGMAWELYELGVTNYNYGNLFYMPIYSAITANNPYTEQHQAIVDLLLDFPADFDRVMSHFDSQQEDIHKYTRYQKTLDPVTRILCTFQAADSSLYTVEMLNELKALL